MKNEVVVDGYTMTRQQMTDYLKAVKELLAKLEAAMAELDAPEPLKHLARMRQRGSGLNGVLLAGGSVQRHYAESFLHDSSDKLTIVDEHGEGHTFRTEEGLRSVWEVVK